MLSDLGQGELMFNSFINEAYLFWTLYTEAEDNEKRIDSIGETHSRRQVVDDDHKILQEKAARQKKVVVLKNVYCHEVDTT